MDRDVETHPSGFSDASLNAVAWRELQTLLGIVLAAALIWWLLRARRQNPAAFAALLFALITYLPVSGIVTLNASVAEHWIYLPSAFLFLAASIQAASVLESRWHTSAIRFAAACLFLLWFLFLGARTFVRTFDWKSEQTFFGRTVATGGDSARMLINLAGVELAEGKLDDAAVHLHTALQRKPDQPFALLTLGSIALKQNDFKLARQLLNRATKMPLVDAQAYEVLAALENKESGKVDLMRLRLAARTGMPDWRIEKRYITVLDVSGSTGAAINELLTCLQTQWYRADSWNLLSELEKKAGHLDQAANALAQARAYDVHLATPPLASSIPASAAK
jgi:protein O-mannosyl-transferase